ncbi:MAG: FtsQ-type protein [Clostridiales bacterium]|jgi:cell division protein FtsQ|nr:FtsQ-type protein [Clostridiales bacterium]
MAKDKIENKIRKRRRILKLLMLIIFICALLILMFKSEYFNVSKIIVENNNFVTTEEVTVLSNVKGENLFLVNKNKLEVNIQKNPYIEGINIRRKLPSTLVIRVIEKQIKGLIKFQNSFINVDNNGKMVQVINKFPNGEIPLIEGINVEQYVPGLNLIKEDKIKQDALETILTLSDYEEYNGLIYSINIEDPYNITFKTMDGLFIKIGDWTDLNSKLTYAYNVLTSEAVKGKMGTIEVLKLQSEYTVIFKES